MSLKNCLLENSLEVKLCLQVNVILRVFQTVALNQIDHYTGSL